MTQNKPDKKTKLSGQIRLPEDLDRAIDMECARLGMFKYEVMEKAWSAYLALKSHAETPHPSESSTIPAKSFGTNAPITATLSQSEQDAVDLLLLILRHASETVKKAIVWNLHGFAEPISRGTHGSSEGVDISEAFGFVREAVEKLGRDEKERGRWLADLGRIQAKLDDVRGKSDAPRKARSGRRGRV